ncbi:hypothetical protein RI129_012736 [Pyrocoelia pectoralis]|uniref:Uncharacterized protein n=1 Tax=Pyrocoelia pectoralis TaxID=417401 RepID=A0AAN7V3F6_9COLE
MSTILHQSDRTKTHVLLCEVYPSFFFYDTKVTITLKGNKHTGRLYEDIDDSPFLSKVMVNFFNEHGSGVLTVDKHHIALWYLGVPGLGFAAVMRFKDTESLVSVIHETFGTRTNPQFVITPCSIIRLVKIDILPPTTNVFEPHCTIGEPVFVPEPRVAPPKLLQTDDFEEKVQAVMSLEHEEDDATGEVEATEFAPEVGEPPKVGKVPIERPRAESVTYFAPVIAERMGILHASTHQCDVRYTKHRGKQAAANAISAIAMLRLSKSRRWFRKVVDEILKYGERIYGDSIKSGPTERPLKVSEVSKSLQVGERMFVSEVEEYTTIGKLKSRKSGVLDLLPALEEFFRNNQTCVVTGPLTVAMWVEDGKFYTFDPNERDQKGFVIVKSIQVGSQIQLLDYKPGVACVTWYTDLNILVEVYMRNVDPNLRREPFFLSKVVIKDYVPIPDDWNEFEGISEGKWILRGTFNQNDRRFDKDVRGTQTTTAAALALAYAFIKPEATWDSDDVNEILIQSEPYYKICVANLQSASKYRDAKLTVGELTRKCILEGNEINFDIEEGLVTGMIDAKDYNDVLNLKSGIATFFRENDSAIIILRSIAVAIWKKDQAYYYYDSLSRDENGVINNYGTACVMRLLTLEELASMIEGNLEPSYNNAFNISRVTITVWEMEEGGISRPPLNNYKEVNLSTAILRSTVTERSCMFKLNKGKQTIPMCLAAVAMMKIYPSSIWNQDIMEEILIVGDKLFVDTMIARERRTDLPVEEDIDEVYPENCLRDFHIGTNNEDDEFELFITSDFYNVMTWFDGNVYYLFDPKPRDECGQIFGKDEWSAKEVEAEEGGGEDDANLVNEMKKKKLSGEGDQPSKVAIIKHSPSYWRAQEKDGAACTMWFTTSDKLIQHVYENTPPNRREDLNFKLIPITVINKPDLKSVFNSQVGREDNYSGDWYAFKEIDHGRWILRGTIDNMDEMFPQNNRGRQSLAMCYAALAYAKRFIISNFKNGTVNDILKYGDRLYTATRKRRYQELRTNKELGLSADEIESILNKQVYGVEDTERVFCIGLDQMLLDVQQDVIIGDIYAKQDGDVIDLKTALQQFFQDYRFGIVACKNMTCAIWKGVKIYYMFDSNSRGPCGLSCPSGEACITRYLNLDVASDVFLSNLPKEGKNGFGIHAVTIKVMLCPRALKPEEKPQKPEPPKYTGIASVMPGKYILQGTFSQDDARFGRGRNVQSAPVAIIALSMSLVHKPNTWTTPIVDDILYIGDELYIASLESLGYEYNPWEKGLTVHLVNKDYKVGSLRANFELRTSDQRGIIDIKHPSIQNIRLGLENFFEENTHGVIESETLTVAIWEEEEQPGTIYMYDPNPRGPAGLYISGGTACLLIFETIKMAADHFIENVTDKSKRKGEFVITPVEIVVGNMKTKPRKKKEHVCKELELRKMASDERKRKEMRRLAKVGRMQYHVLSNGDAILRGTKSQSSKEYSANSRGNQDIANCFAAFVVHRLSPVSSWHYKHIDMILDVGDQLYKDSYITYCPRNPKLGMENILRKVFIKEVEVALTVYKAVMMNMLNAPNLELALLNYFQQEQFCIISTRNEHVAVFFKEGLYYIFDPHDCDVEGNRNESGVACVMKFPSIPNLVSKYIANYAKADDDSEFTITLITVGSIVVKNGKL